MNVNRLMLKNELLRHKTMRSNSFSFSSYIMQLVTPRVVAIAVAIDTMSWIISFQVYFFVSVLIKLFFLLNINFLEVRGER